ncbi:glucose dehydrogenase [FAD, quinone]-like [Ciona intestinalis]
MSRLLYTALLVVAIGYVVQRLRVRHYSICREKAEEQYDFIIVGAGTTGSVIASRISEITHIKVLLLEAGEEDSPNFLISTPTLVTALQAQSTDWKYRTVPQKTACHSLNDNVAFWPRGKVLGGSSSINYMVYARGSRYDYDAWELYGATGWGFDNVESNFKKAEQVILKPNEDSSLGKDGPLKMETGFINKATEWFVEAGIDIGYKLFDYNAGTGDGFSVAKHTLKDGARQSASLSYLHSVAHERPNLHIISGAHVQKILFNKEKDVPKAVGVEYVKNGDTFKVMASKEVIVSGGAIGTPHLLLVSGIGPKKQLEDFKVDVVADLPGVGSNLQDHPFVPVGFSSEYNNITESVMNWWTILSPKNILSYLYDGSGPLGTPTIEGIALLNLSSKLEADKPLDWPDIHFIMQALQWNVKSKMHLDTLMTNFNFKESILKETIEIGQEKWSDFNILLALSHPHSRGSITLNSPDINVHPAIDPRYLEDERDMKIILKAFKVLEKLEESETYKSLGIKMSIAHSECESTTEIRSDAYYECVARFFTLTEYHPCCTAKMGRSDDVMAVTDPRLRVYKVTGLRLTDASVWPTITSANTQAPCYMVGEKAADMIKQDWNL